MKGGECMHGSPIRMLVFGGWMGVTALWICGCTMSAGTGTLDMSSEVAPGGRQAIHATGEHAELTVMNQGPGVVIVHREDAPAVEVRVDSGGEATVRGVKHGKGCFDVTNVSHQPARVRIRIRNARSMEVREPAAAAIQAAVSIRETVTTDDVPCLAALRGDAALRTMHAGTGARISATRVVTCAHVWPPDAVLATVNGQVEALWIVVEHGTGGGSQHDWVVLGMAPSTAPRYEVDPSYVPKAGEAIVVCGYPATERGGQFPESSVPPLRMFDGHVVPVPAGLPDAEQLVFFRTERCDIRGLSGGPALAWDERRGKAVLFGIVTESVTVWHDDVVADHVHAIRTLSFLGTERAR